MRTVNSEKKKMRLAVIKWNYDFLIEIKNRLIIFKTLLTDGPKH